MTTSKGSTKAPATDLVDRLALLPRRALILTHDSRACAELLAKTAEGLLSAAAQPKPARSTTGAIPVTLEWAPGLGRSATI